MIEITAREQIRGRIELAANALSSLPLYQRVPGGRRTVIVGLFGLAATLAGCGGQEQHITYLTPTVNSNTEIDGTPVANATSLENVDGTTLHYLKLEVHVPKGNSLILALDRGSQQGVGEFDSQTSLNTYIADHKRANVPLYRQPQLYPQDTTQLYILVLEQDTRDAVDLIILARDGAKPEYECRLAPNDQVNTIIGQMRRVHPQLQGVQPYTLIDYQFTLPADPNFA